MPPLAESEYISRMVGPSGNQSTMATKSRWTTIHAARACWNQTAVLHFAATGTSLTTGMIASFLTLCEAIKCISIFTRVHARTSTKELTGCWRKEHDPPPSPPPPPPPYHLLSMTNSVALALSLSHNWARFSPTQPKPNSTGRPVDIRPAWGSGLMLHCHSFVGFRISSCCLIYLSTVLSPYLLWTCVDCDRMNVYILNGCSTDSEHESQCNYHQWCYSVC